MIQMVTNEQNEKNKSYDKGSINELIRIKFDENKIVPDYLNDYPKDIINIIFPSGAKINLGNKVSSYQIKLKPCILYWPVQFNSLYTTIIIDLDYNKSSKKCFLLFLVMNIHANDINKADILADYIPSTIKDIDCHRILILVFKQKQFLKNDEHSFEILKKIERKNFHLKKFIEKYNLDKPSFGNFFLTRSELNNEKKNNF